MPLPPLHEIVTHWGISDMLVAFYNKVSLVLSTKSSAHTYATVVTLLTHIPRGMPGAMGYEGMAFTEKKRAQKKSVKIREKSFKNYLVAVSWLMS